LLLSAKTRTYAEKSKITLLVSAILSSYEPGIDITFNDVFAFSGRNMFTTIQYAWKIM